MESYKKGLILITINLAHCKSPKEYQFYKDGTVHVVLKALSAYNAFSLIFVDINFCQYLLGTKFLGKSEEIIRSNVR